MAPRWIAERPDSRYVLFVPLLLAWEAWRHRPRPPTRHARMAWACLGGAPLAMLAGFESGSPTVGLAGVALGVIGVATWTGRPPLPVPLLALWAIPVPIFLLERLSPELETLWMDAVARIATGLGASIEQTGPVAFGAARTRVEFFSVDDGLVLAHGMSLVGFWHAIRRQATPGGLLARTLAYGVLGFALQAVVLLTAVMRASDGDAAMAATVLVHGPSLSVALFIAWIALVEPRLRPTTSDAANEDA